MKLDAQRDFDWQPQASWLEEQRAAGHRIVFTNGCFDLLHAGHLHLLEQARAAGDCLVVGLNSDASVRRLKGPTRPKDAQTVRANNLMRTEWVDCVLTFEDDTPLRLIEWLRPDVIVKGGDWSPERIVGRAFVESHGGSVRTIPLLPGFSTTRLIEQVAKIDRLP